jgi:hypothetical protein
MLSCPLWRAVPSENFKGSLAEAESNQKKKKQTTVEIDMLAVLTVVQTQKNC